MTDSTNEPEITAPVDLATPDGSKLNHEAIGWSRTPLHRANLSGSWGRNKRWDYWAVLAGDLVVSVVYANIDYMGLAELWWADLAGGASGGARIVSPLARGIDLPDLPGSTPLRLRRKNLDLDIADSADGSTHIWVRWRDKNGTPGELDATVRLPAGHESLNVVIPWSDKRFQYTSKHQARPVHGLLTLGEVHHRLHDTPQGAWGVLDVGRGRWPYQTTWNWGGGAGRATAGAPVVGIQVGGRWTEGTGFTENGVIVDGRLTKIGAELVWRYEWDDPMRPWKVTDPSGHLELVLSPRFDRHSRTDLFVLRTETHQVFGTWSGHVVDDSGTRIELRGIQGFAEESRSRW